MDPGRGPSRGPGRGSGRGAGKGLGRGAGHGAGRGPGRYRGPCRGAGQGPSLGRGLGRGPVICLRVAGKPFKRPKGTKTKFSSGKRAFKCIYNEIAFQLFPGKDL